MTNDEIVGWHPRLNEHDFEPALGMMIDREAQLAAVRGIAKSQRQLTEWN